MWKIYARDAEMMTFFILYLVADYTNPKYEWGSAPDARKYGAHPADHRPVDLGSY